jgi:hypothetical protein
MWQNDRDDVTIRTAVATFTKKEIQNLADFGDLVAIDPTFPPLGCNVISWTLVRRDRETRSVGLVISVTSAEVVFQGILALLTEVIPCQDIIQTIVSDDELAL